MLILAVPVSGCESDAMGPVFLVAVHESQTSKATPPPNPPFLRVSSVEAPPGHRAADVAAPFDVTSVAHAPDAPLPVTQPGT